jgi:hypothetical protein
MPQPAVTPSECPPLTRDEPLPLGQAVGFILGMSALSWGVVGLIWHVLVA